MANNKVQKRKYVIGLLVLLAMATVSTYAWTANEDLNTDPTTVYVTSNPETATTISGYSSKPMGKNKISIEFTVEDAAANVEFMFIDADGEIIECDRSVSFDGGAALVPTDGVYSVASGVFTVDDHEITITRAAGQTDTDLWKDLVASTGAVDDTFAGLMIVIK